MSGSVDQRIVNFNRSFETWNIELLKEAVENRQRGKIVKSGWIIWYLFSRDETGDYLDYYPVLFTTEHIFGKQLRFYPFSD